jgi:hypothetical protein
MADLSIAPIVEGQGEVEAVRVLLRRMAAEIAPDVWVDFLRPHRIGRDALIKQGGIETAVALAARQISNRGSVLILIDADDDCAATVGPQLAERARAAHNGLGVSVVLAVREFEAWFLASAPSLAGRRGLAPDLQAHPAPESPRGCKEWLSQHRTDGRSYRPAADQAALTELFDLHLARKNSPSFDKLWRDLERLLRHQTHSS